MKNINAKFEIEKKLPLIKEVFIEFYGEEYRNMIEEKINNILIITHISKLEYYDKKNELSKTYRMIEYENLYDFLKKLNISSQDIESYEAILRQWLNEQLNTKVLKNIFINHLNKIYPNINNEEMLSINERISINRYLKKIKNEFKKTKRKIKVEKEKYKEIELIQKYNKKLIDKLDQKYLNIFIEQLETKLNKIEYNELKKDFTKCKNYNEMAKICCQKLPEKKQKYVKTMVKVLNSAEKIEYNEALTGINTKEEIENMNFLEKTFANAYRLIENNSITVPNFIRKNNKNILYSIIIYDLNTNSNYIDATIIHELNHCIEREIIKENDKEIVLKCAWSKIVYSKQKNNNLKLSKRKSKKEKYNSVIFTEIINELITQDIMRIMHENNIYIINNKETSKIEDGTLYEKIKFIAKPFYEKYKNIIIESRINNDLNSIKEKLGEENLIELNKLINKAYKKNTIELCENSLYYTNKTYEILTNMDKYQKHTKIKKR